MCGRYVFNPDENFYDRFKLANRIDSLVPSFNVSPGSTMPIIAKDSDSEENRVTPMVWGLNLGWKKEGRDITLINNRADTLLTKPSFKNKIQSKRCLVPASGFYEWSHEKTNHIPYYFSLKNKEMFSFAGIYDKDTYSIITTDANDIVCPVHNRMPVIIDKKDEEKWLSPNLALEEIAKILSPFSNEKMEAYSVSTKVNQVSVDSPDLLTPYSYE